MGQLEQEPTPPFCLVDPIFQQARGSYVVMLAAEIVRFAHPRRQLFVVIVQLGEHVRRRHVVGIIVEKPLEADAPAA